jgi:peptidoglycan/xylan/chitin deacetylase (PgdA/CDA1 family)
MIPPAPHGWGPDGRRAAVSVCFDNLGEARDVGEGTWPQDRAHGAHPSAVESLPRILAALEELDVRASFFVEGWNLDVYPDQIDAIVDRGHDLGLHGWVHESWGRLPVDEEAELLDRSVAAAARLGVHFDGFRPPGGLLTGSTLRLLRERRFRFCSPLADAVTLSDEVAVLPFQWRVVDAYHCLEELAGLRRSLGDPVDVASPTECASALRRALRVVIGNGQYTTLTFHPFLMLDPEAQRVARDLIAELASDADVWCAPGSQLAAWVTEHRDEFAGPPVLGTASWK